MLLEIAIPTYNRPDRLLATIQTLSPQITEHIGVLIIDNDSDHFDGALLLESFPESARDRIRILRNSGNIGMAANIMRCFEEAQGKWVYLLGDDDTVSDRFVELVTSAIDRHAGCDQINFSSFNDRPNCFVLNTMDAFAESLDSYAALNYISSNAYLSHSVKPALRYGYMFSYTLSPHVAVTLSILANGGSIVMEKAKPVNRPAINAEQHWSWTQFVIANGVLLEHPGLNDTQRKKLGRKICGCAKVLEKTTFNLLLLARKGDRYSEARYLYTQAVSRWFYWAPWDTKLRCRLYKLLFLAPTIAVFLIIFLLKATGRKDKAAEYLKTCDRFSRI